MQHFGKAALRVTKNYTKGYSDAQAKVREATSNDPWGPSGSQMNEIAQLTYNQNDFIEIVEMLDKRLCDKGKNWRHVFKSLTVLDYCLHHGSENVVIYFRDNLYIIKTLKEFQYIDEYGKDQGANVRQRAKDLTNLLMDEDRLREERRSRAQMRDRMVRGASREEDDENTVPRRDGNSQNGPAENRPNRDEDELRRAIEESKKSLAQEMVRVEEQELQDALKASEEDGQRRRNDFDSSNSSRAIEERKRSLAQEIARMEEQELQALLKASEEELKRRKVNYGSNPSALFDDAAPPSNSNSTPGASPLTNPTSSWPVPDAPHRFPMNLAGPPLQESENLAKSGRVAALPGPPIRH
ncbi:hypothetical protein H1R20_g13479, partial [Candolleomyces eurysporus]